MDIGKIIADILTRFFLSRAALERWLLPHVNVCRRCKRPWIVPAFRRKSGGVIYYQKNRNKYWGLIGVHHHMTDYRSGHGCFAICEQCWGELPPEECIKYYEELINEWRSKGYPVSDADVQAIKDAVLKGNGSGHREGS